MAAEQVKLYGNENDLIERIKKDDTFGLSAMELEVLPDPVKFTGMAEYQCEKFVTETVKPLLEKNKQRVNVEAQVNVSKEGMHMLTSIVGTNWDDEGKGRMVDFLSENDDIVVRYQGGNNAGHTVINEKGKFVMNLMPSGICREDTVNILGPGIVIDLEHLYGEVQKLAEKGVEVTPEHLKISDRATSCMPYHKLMDCLEEDRLLNKKFGSTRRGISPVYADKYMKKALRMGDLLHPEALKERLGGLVEWKNLTVENGYGHAPVLAEEMFLWLKEYGEFFVPFICDTTEYLASKPPATVEFE